MAFELGTDSGQEWIDSLLRSYSAIFFSRSRLVGATLMAGTALVPRSFVYGMAAVVLATVCARALKVDPGLIREGAYGYNALLVGLGTAALFDDGTLGVAALGAAALVSVVATAAFRSMFASTMLPILTAPFLVVYFLVVATATSLGVSLNLLPTGPELMWLPEASSLFLKSLGMIFFLPRVDVGLVLLGALFLHSRFALLCALLSFGVAWIVMQVSALEVLAGESFPMLLTLNLVFTAMAIGGVWFVPSRASLSVAILASLVAAAMSISMAPVLGFFGLPVLILPFNLAIWMMLFAMRQRTADTSPKAVTFVPGTPEQNFTYNQTYIARFGAHYALRFRAPFNGIWTCTQGVDGEFTHRGLWRHAFDFEVTGRDAKTYRGRGHDVRDYHAYNLPVVAPAPGLVVHVVNHVPDNPIGGMNLVQNWGNLVLLYHAPGLYSMVCHLVPGSVRVKQGQWVAVGEELGRCGNSGRSPVPHLHFQLQGLPRVGAPTIPTELHDVFEVRSDHDDELLASLVVREGQRVRNIRSCDRIRQRFSRFEPGRRWSWVDREGGSERLEVKVDAQGRTLLESDWGARLYFELDDQRFVIYDVVGPRNSALYALRAAVGRVPFDDARRVRWVDHLPHALVFGPVKSAAYDFIAPFRTRPGVEVRYSLEYGPSSISVEGVSCRRNGKPWLRTRATFHDDGTVELLTESAHKSLVLRSPAVNELELRYAQEAA